MILNLNPLEKSIASLQEALEFSYSDLAKKDTRLFQQFRNSVIQCFKYTYEFRWKMIRRRLKQDLPNPSVIDEMSFADMMRDAARYGLIDDPTTWIQYRRERNVTSHTYNEKIAQEVYESAIKFCVEAKKLLQNLQAKNP